MAVTNVKIVVDKTSKLLVKAKLGNKWLDFLVDTGAFSTCVSLDTAEECGLLPHMNHKPTLHINTDRPQQMAIGEVSNIDMVIEGVEQNMVVRPCIIVHKVLSMPLLGLDVLVAYKAIIYNIYLYVPDWRRKKTDPPPYMSLEATDMLAVPHTPKDMINSSMLVNGHPVTALFDTGAYVTTLTTPQVLICQLSMVDLSMPLTLKCPCTSTLTLKKQCKFVRIVVGDHVSQTNIWVSDLSRSAVLGMVNIRRMCNRLSVTTNGIVLFD